MGSQRNIWEAVMAERRSVMVTAYEVCAVSILMVFSVGALWHGSLLLWFGGLFMAAACLVNVREDWIGWVFPLIFYAVGYIILSRQPDGRVVWLVLAVIGCLVAWCFMPVAKPSDSGTGPVAG